MLQLLQLPLVSSNPDAAPAGTHTCQLGCSSKSVPISHPDPTPDDHHCIGPGCPKCNPKTDQTPDAELFAAYLSALYFHAKCNSAPGSDLQKAVYFLESAIVAPVSHPDPPHVCKDIPCAYCGRKW